MVTVKTFFLKNSFPLRILFVQKEKSFTSVNITMHYTQRSIRITTLFRKTAKAKLRVSSLFRHPSIRINVNRYGRSRMPLRTVFYRYETTVPASLSEYLQELGVSLT